MLMVHHYLITVDLSQILLLFNMRVVKMIASMSGLRFVCRLL